MSYRSRQIHRWASRNLAICRDLMPDLRDFDKEAIHSWIKVNSTPQREGITPRIDFIISVV